MIIENATITERSSRGRVIALRIFPNEGYVLRLAQTDDNGETVYQYSDLYYQVPIARADTELPLIDAIPLADVPQAEETQEGAEE